MFDLPFDLSLRLSNEFDNLLGAALHRGCREDVRNRRIFQDLAAFFDLRALKADNDRNREGFAVLGDDLRSLDDAVRDVVAAIDAAEDVDEDALRLAAFAIFSGSESPPTSRKLAGSPP